MWLKLPRLLTGETAACARGAGVATDSSVQISSIAPAARQSVSISSLPECLRILGDVERL